MAQPHNTVLSKTPAFKWAGRSIAALGFGLCWALATLTAAAADARNTPNTPDTPDTPDETLGKLSDAQLTNLAADWQQLDASARSDLIAETRERMQPATVASAPVGQPNARSEAATGALKADNLVSQKGLPSSGAPQARAPAKITLRAQRRRYGRIVRKADGSLVRIETQVVTVQRRDPQRAFGVGFERRQRQHGPEPVTTVSTVPESALAAPAAQIRASGVIAVTKPLN